MKKEKKKYEGNVGDESAGELAEKPNAPEIPKSEKHAKREVEKFKPTEWAKMKGLDPHLFLYWENQLMDEQEFEEIKKKLI